MDNKDKFEYTYFFSDNKFILWRLSRTEELDKYWSDFVKENPHSREAIDIAIEKFKVVQLNKRHLPEEKINDLHEKILLSSSKQLSKKKKLKYYFYAAACFLLLVASSLLIQQIGTKKVNPSPETIVGQTLPSENIQLILGGETIGIKQNADLELLPEGKITILEESEAKASEISVSQKINKLIVPYGKRSTLLLSDGSKVWLNSGTELEFPSSFESGERRINILRGEIYIEVKEDKNKLFYVQTTEFDVRVYGTKFNVSCYKNSEKSVVLVDGKVEIQSENKNLMLNPGELFSINEGKVTHRKVNIDEYTSWKDGMFIFKQIPISDLLKKIGRYYNIDFKNNKSEMIDRTCTGKLYLSENMEQVMNIVCVISNTSYKKEGNTIYIIDNESSKK